MRDPYQVLGVAKTANNNDIKKAYRKLAKANHPDQNKDPKAKDRFTEATQAYDLLSDEKKRAAFDRGEIDADGKPTYQGFEGFTDGRSGARAAGFDHFDYHFGQGASGGGDRGGFDPADMFADLFGAGRARGRSSGAGAGAGIRQPVRGSDIEASVTLPLEDIAQGGKQRISLPNGRTLEVNIPASIEEGKVIRLKGQGQAGANGGEAGDALITVKFGEHPLFRRSGNNLRLDLPITLYEAVLGASVEVPTLTGTVEVNVPPGAHHGRSIRLRGKGLAKAGTVGDLLVSFKIVLPEHNDPELDRLMQQWRDKQRYFPRKSMANTH